MSRKMRMQIYGTGFNAHGQLKPECPDRDLVRFEKLYEYVDEEPGRTSGGSSVQVLCALWSCTVWRVGEELFYLGYRPIPTHHLRPELASGGGEVDKWGSSTRIHIAGPSSASAWASRVRSVFGDVSGVRGAVMDDGMVWVFRDGAAEVDGDNGGGNGEAEPRLEPCQVRRSVRYVAVLDNGQVCVNESMDESTEAGGRTDARRSSASSVLHVFAGLADLFEQRTPICTHVLAKPVVQLCGAATSFTALTADGEVLTFGSGLHAGVLGRRPSPSEPALTPFPVSYLGGIPIRKVASAGWITAALSADRDLYLWGGRPGEANRMESLPPLDGDELVSLVDIDGGVDVVDVGVGHGHVAALTTNGEIWTSGLNTYGQLGDGFTDFRTTWIKATLDTDAPSSSGVVHHLGCGVWSSWAVVHHP